MFNLKAENRKTRNTILMWSCDPKSATPLLRNGIDWSQEWRFDGTVFLSVYETYTQRF